MNAGAWIGLIGGALGLIVGVTAAVIASPVSGSLFAAVFIGIFFAVYWFFFRPIIVSGKLMKTGVQRNGKILEMWDTGVTINNDPQVGLKVEVEDGQGKTYTVKTKSVISRLEAANIHPGLPVTVRVDPRDPQKIAIEKIGAYAGGSAQVAPEAMEDYKAAMEKILTQIDATNRDIMLTGIPAQAKVIAYYDLNVKVNGDNPFVLLFLQVIPGLKDPFYAEAKGVVKDTSVPKFQPGSMISIKYDPNNPERVVVDHS